MKKFNISKDKIKEWKTRFSDYWEKHGFAVVLLFCAGIIGVTAFFGSRMNAQETDISPTPVPTLRAARITEPAEQAIVATPQPSPTPIPTPSGMPWPLSGEVQVGYHADTLVYNETLNEYATHLAIDIAAAEGADIVVPMDGIVERAYIDPSLGNVVILRHENGLKTGYASLESLDGLKEGMAAKRGMTLAKAGNSAPCESLQGIHLHFFVFDQQDTPVDPMTVLSDAKQ